MKTGIELMALERAEQISKHGFTPETDKNYNGSGELVILIKYLLMDDIDAEKDVLYEYFTGCNYNMRIIDGFNAKNRVEKLVIAGALIAAEIDRIQ